MPAAFEGLGECLGLARVVVSQLGSRSSSYVSYEVVVSRISRLMLIDSQRCSDIESLIKILSMVSFSCSQSRDPGMYELTLGSALTAAFFDSCWSRTFNLESISRIFWPVHRGLSPDIYLLPITG